MPKPSKIHEIESREGKPIKQVLIESYAKHGRQHLVAAALGISAATLSTWLLQQGLSEKMILVPRQAIVERESVKRFDMRTIEEIPIWE